MHDILVGKSQRGKFNYSIPSIEFEGAASAPFLDGCRKLIENGANPADQAIMTRDGNICLTGTIGLAARLTVSETTGRPRLIRYVPFTSGAVAHAFKSAAATSPTDEA